MAPKMMRRQRVRQGRSSLPGLASIEVGQMRERAMELHDVEKSPARAITSRQPRPPRRTRDNTTPIQKKKVQYPRGV
jgi:hypothetical protein